MLETINALRIFFSEMVQREMVETRMKEKRLNLGLFFSPSPRPRNHACQPNASTIYDETARVAILFSQRHPSCRRNRYMLLHTPFFDLQPYSRLVGSIIPESVSVEEELNLFRKFMSSTHGIIFPSNCFCYESTTLLSWL